ncbi:MAG: hypothetical protein QXD89_02470 [Candidatus Aenigmatarchaeota archaeon]
MNGNEEWEKLYQKYRQKSTSKKWVFLALFFIFFFSILFLFLSSLFHVRFESNFVLVENLPTFNKTDYSIGFSKVPRGEKCYLYLSGPNKKIVFLYFTSCEEVSKKRFRVAELVSNFEREAGEYVLILKSERGDVEEIEFMVS